MICNNWFRYEAWWRQTSHYLNQYWQSFAMPFGITGPQWVNYHCTCWWPCTINRSSAHFNFRYGLAHWGRGKIAAIFQTTYSNAFSWMKMFEFWLTFHISLKFVPKGSVNNIPALVQIMAWRQSGDKPFYWRIYVSLGLNVLKVLYPKNVLKKS